MKQIENYVHYNPHNIKIFTKKLFLLKNNQIELLIHYIFLMFSMEAFCEKFCLYLIIHVDMAFDKLMVT